jgi:hypothetical protein
MIIANYQNGSLIHQPLPQGFEWIEVPETRQENGGFLSYTAVAICPEEKIDELDTESVRVHEKYPHITNLIDTHYMGRDCIGVYYTDGQNWNIEFDVF